MTMPTRSLPGRRAYALAAALLAIGLAACDPAADPAAVDEAPAARTADDAVAAVGAVVHKSPTCECCGGHEAHLEEEGFRTRTVLHDDDLAAWKEGRGIPRELQSCHTTEIGGYLVEGHVPAETIARLLEAQPAVDGIALPGMPAGSPGMGGAQDEPWIIHAFADGEPAGVFEVR
jgi:hypothetical protein